MNMNTVAQEAMTTEVEQSTIDSVVQEAQEVVEQLTTIDLLDSKAKLAEVIQKVNELIGKVNNLSRPKTESVARDRGPKSTRTMTESDAERVMLGDLKDKSHKEAAELLGLAYGQIYSARGGYTFKTVYQRKLKADHEAKQAN